MGHITTNRASSARATLGIAATTLLLLAIAAPALATDQHLYDPVLSLTGNTTVTTEDPVPDPGPTHPPKGFLKPCGTTTDSYGNVYVASVVEVSFVITGGRIDVFGPAGQFLLEFEVDHFPCDMAVDSQGNLYVGGVGGNKVGIYAPSAYPPSASSTFSLAKKLPVPVVSGCPESTAIAVDPSNDHLHIGHSCRLEEYGPAAEGSPFLGEIQGAPRMRGMDVYGKNHDYYVAALDQNPGGDKLLPSKFFVIDGDDGSIKCELLGATTPGLEEDLDFGIGAAVAVDQSNGDAYVYDVKHGVVYQFAVKGKDECGFIGRLPAPPALSGNSPLMDIAVDAPLQAGEAGYHSPNKGYVFVTSGKNAAGSHLFAYEPVAAPEFPLTVSKPGSGTGKVTSSPPGIDCGSDCDELYNHGTVVTLEADPDPGSEFTGFSGACTGSTCEVTMSAAKSVTANFDEESVTPEFLLTVDVEGTGSGTVTSDKGLIACDPVCSDEYAEGTVVVLTATADPGSIFVSWKKCDTGKVNGRQCTITVDKAKTVKAVFTTTHALEVSRAGSGLGKVQSTPGGVLCLANCSETTASFKEGTVVTLKQTPAKHFHFVQWLGDCTGSGACEVTMGEDHEVQAEFAEDAKHLLTLTKSGGGQGTVKGSVAGINCGATCSEQASAYFQGTVVELSATPGKGSAFGGWSGACTGAGACTVTMSEAKEVEATFE